MLSLWVLNWNGEIIEVFEEEDLNLGKTAKISLNQV